MYVMGSNVRRTHTDVKGEREDTGQPHPAGAAHTRRPRGSLTRPGILDAAEAAAEEGFAGLTMRAVAARLGAAPMALYNHFATKEELVDALLDRVLGRFAPPPPTGDWRADLRGFAHAHRRVLVQHPWAVAPLFSHPTPGPGAVRIGEIGLAILARGGTSDGDAVATFSGIVALNYGWSSFTVVRRPEQVRGALAALPESAYPRTVAAATELAAYGSDRHYDTVLDAFLRGLDPGGSPGDGEPAMSGSD